MSLAHFLLRYFSLRTIVRTVIFTGYSLCCMFPLVVVIPVVLWAHPIYVPLIAVLLYVVYLLLIAFGTFVWLERLGFKTFGIWRNTVKFHKLLLPRTIDSVRFVSVSDTHSRTSEMLACGNVIPDGDVFICCGDFSYKGTIQEIEGFARFLKSISDRFSHIIIVPGNHDLTLDAKFYNEEWSKWHKAKEDCQKIKDIIRNAVIDSNCYLHFLEHESIEINGLKIFGSPYVPSLGGIKMAYNKTKDERKNLWKTIPSDIDILITHGPPSGILDRMMFYLYRKRGDVELRQELDTGRFTNLKYHVFGHVHEQYGWIKRNGITFVNASICTMTYYPVHPPPVFDVKKVKN